MSDIRTPDEQARLDAIRRRMDRASIGDGYVDGSGGGIPPAGVGWLVGMWRRQRESATVEELQEAVEGFDDLRNREQGGG